MLTYFSPSPVSIAYQASCNATARLCREYREVLLRNIEGFVYAVFYLPGMLLARLAPCSRSGTRTPQWAVPIWHPDLIPSGVPWKYNWPPAEPTWHPDAMCLDHSHQSPETESLNTLGYLGTMLNLVVFVIPGTRVSSRTEYVIYCTISYYTRPWT